MKYTNDNILITELKQGNSKAFELLFNKYNKKVYNFANYTLRNKNDAEGVVQEVFMRVWTNRHDIAPEKSFSGYLFILARNIIYNQLKKKIHEKHYRDFFKRFWTEDINNTQSELDYNEMSEILNQIINTLPEKRKQVFILNRINGLSVNDISVKLNISPNTVDTQIRRSLSQIRENLKKYYDGVMYITLLFLFL